MERRRGVLLGVWLAVAAGLVPALWAQPITVEASADRTAATLDDRIRLDVVVRGQLRGTPQLQPPSLDDFRTVQTGTSQSYTLVNGQMDASYTFTYILEPAREGDLVIPPFQVTFLGKDYRTAPIHVQVQGQAGTPALPGTGPGQSRDLFAVADVDKKRVYVNEQVLYTFYLYYAVRVSNLNYTPPKFEGFWVEKLQEGEKQYHKIMNGRRYLVIEVSTALFPTTSGKLTIEVSNLRLLEISERSFSFFERGVDRSLRTQPVELEVLPLPQAGRPADFDGAVGEDLQLAARLDRSQVPEGEPVTMTVTVSGAGNVRTFSKPRLPELPAFKVYDADSQTDVENLDRVKGTRTYEIVLVPRGPGEFTIPPVRLAYFDTRTSSFKTLETEPLHIEATPVAGAERLAASDVPPQQQDIEVLGRDIAHIRTDVAVADALTPLYARGFFLLLAPVPLVALGLAVGSQRRRERFAADVALARSSRARKVARKRLAAAARLLAAGHHQEFHAEIQRALFEYVGHKLNVAAAGLTYATLRARLAAVGAEPVADKLVQLLESCDAARFAQGSSTPERMGELLRAAESLVMGLEAGWNRKSKRFAALALLMGCGFLAWGQTGGLAAAQGGAPGESLVAEPLQVQRSPAAEFAPPAETLQRAHAAYEAGRYMEAAGAYRQAETLGVRNGPLYYDLGNACFKSGQLGEAIAAYRRAERLMPRDPLVRVNLEFVLARREDKPVQPAVPFPITLLRAMYRWMNLNEWILFTLGLYALACAVAVYRVVTRDRRFLVRLALFGTVGALVLAGAALAYKIHDERGIARAVIIADKSAVMSGPGKDYTVEFWLHEGSEVQIEETRPDWLRVSLGAKLRGWIRAASVVRI